MLKGNTPPDKILRPFFMASRMTPWGMLICVMLQERAKRETKHLRRSGLSMLEATMGG